MDITPGEWIIRSVNKEGYLITPNNPYSDTPYKHLAKVFRISNEIEAAANAELIAEAGTVKNETGFSPRQLAEQKAVLLELVKLFNYACKQILEGGHIDAKYYEKKCDKAIKSATK